MWRSPSPVSNAPRGKGDVVVELARAHLVALADLLWEGARLVQMVVPPQQLAAKPELLDEPAVGEVVGRALVWADLGGRFYRSARRAGGGRLVGLRMKRSEARIFFDFVCNGIKGRNRTPYHLLSRRDQATYRVLMESFFPLAKGAFPVRGRRPPSPNPETHGDAMAWLAARPANRSVGADVLRSRFPALTRAQARNLIAIAAIVRWIRQPPPGRSLTQLLELSE